jgi:hypothetical protein
MLKFLSRMRVSHLRIPVHFGVRWTEAAQECHKRLVQSIKTLVVDLAIREIGFQMRSYRRLILVCAIFWFPTFFNNLLGVHLCCSTRRTGSFWSAFVHCASTYARCIQSIWPGFLLTCSLGCVACANLRF